MAMPVESVARPLGTRNDPTARQLFQDGYEQSFQDDAP